MPRGYELNYYDSMRAVQRKIYSEEIKRFSSKLKQLGYYTDNIYGIIISKINDGIYDNLGKMYAQSHFQNANSLKQGLNKSSRGQDFMSPMELRLNSIAVKNAIDALIINRRRDLSIQNVIDLAYSAGEEAASTFQILKYGPDELSFEIKSPVLSSQPIVKKYNKSLVMGTWPKGREFEYKDHRAEEITELKIQNKTKFNEVKELLKKHLETSSLRKAFFQYVNLGYYNMTKTDMQNLEITALLFDKEFIDSDKKLSHKELTMNLEKLSMVKNMLEDNKNINRDNIFSNAFCIGQKARNIIVEEHRLLPEMYSGFYEIYSRQQSMLQIKKETLKQQNK